MRELRNEILEYRVDACPMISVIVPTHNRPDMLEIAIQSILNQTFKDFEIIVVNDNGEDVSRIVASFDTDKIIYITHERNKGLAAARNTGIRAARGKYIAYLDDDDVYYSNHLEELVTLLEGTDVSVAYTDAYRAMQVLQNGTYVTTQKDTPYSFDFDYDRILIENFIPVLCIMHRRVCLDQSGYFDESLDRHEDWDLWIRMSRHYKFAHIPKVTCEFTYRSDGSGMTSGSLPKFLTTLQKIYHKYASEKASDSSIALYKKKSLFETCLRVFYFISERIDIAVPVAELPYTELASTGATTSQIRSCYYWKSAAICMDREQSILLLEKALFEDDQNYPAKIDLVSNYLEAGRNSDAVRLLAALEQANPLEPHFAASRKKIEALNSHVELIPNPQTLPAMRVVAYSLDAPNSACAQLRIMQPLSSLQNQIMLLWGASNDGRTCATNLESLEKADLIVIQRFYPRKETLPYLEAILASGKPVIYETDDDLMSLPGGHPLKQWGDETAGMLRQLLPRFSAVTVSTERLKERYSRFNPATYVLPNLLDDSRYERKISVNRDVVTIGFSGTATHAADIKGIEPVLQRIATRYRDAVTFCFIGHAPEIQLSGKIIAFQNDYLGYVDTLRHSDMDIALIPLVDTEFNQAKSNIKWLEYSACGIAGIFADMAPYNSCIEHGTTGLLVGADPEQWFQAICLLVEHPELRMQLAANARHKVLEEFTLKSKARLWLDTYRNILANYSIRQT